MVLTDTIGTPRRRQERPVIGFRATPEIAAAVKEAAARGGVDPSKYVRQVVVDHLNQEQIPGAPSEALSPEDREPPQHFADATVKPTPGAIALEQMAALPEQERRELVIVLLVAFFASCMGEQSEELSRALDGVRGALELEGVTQK